MALPAEIIEDEPAFEQAIEFEDGPDLGLDGFTSDEERHKNAERLDRILP